MRRASLICMMLWLVSGVSGALAAPGGGQDEKPWSWPIIVTATVPEVEPNDVCPGQTIGCSDLVSPASYATTTDDDWYAFYVDEAGTMVTIGTQPYQGSSVDTYLELYDLCGGGCLTYDDDGGPGFFSLISNFAAPHSGWYYVKTFTYNHLYTGGYELFVYGCTPVPPPPPNDQCSGAIPIDRCTTGTLNGNDSNTVNNYDPGIPGPSCTGFSASGKDVVYLLTTQAGDLVHLDYLQPSADASFYIVTDCSNVSESCVIGADATVTGQHEIIDWTAGTGTYYLILDSYTANYGGPWTLAWDITCPTPLGVCCVGHTCYLIHDTECAGTQGHWHPEWTSCGPPNPCDAYTPADKESWGTIKNAYR
jgi:hypothetical protein